MCGGFHCFWFFVASFLMHVVASVYGHQDVFGSSACASRVYPSVCLSVCLFIHSDLSLTRTCKCCRKDV